MFRGLIHEDRPAVARHPRCGDPMPWEAEPHRLWSLFDMWVHLAGNWMAVVNSLERVKWHMSLVADNPDDERCWQQFVKGRATCLVWMREEIAALPFSASLHLQSARVLDDVESADPRHRLEAVRVCARIEDLAQNIQSELKAQLFLVVPAARKSWFKEGDDALFGQIVADAFPDSTPEIAEAGRCFALARWTSCVFHLMRGLELAIHRWAAELEVDQFKAIELENWKNILDAGQKKIDALQRLPKSPERDAKLAYFSETQVHFRAIKDAWRNHVAHARERYDEERALSILSHTREFMRLLADFPS